MKKSLIAVLAAASVVMLASCNTYYVGNYYLKDSFGFSTVCLVDNKEAPASFFIALRKAVEDKGLQVTTVMDHKQSEAACPATITYEAQYLNSPFPHLDDASLSLLIKDRPTEVVKLKKQEAAIPLFDKMSDEEPVIRDMVNRLLPRGTPW